MMAKDLDIPVIVLAQLNRDVEKEKNRKPRASDLRESARIEQEADIVILLYKVNPEEENAGSAIEVGCIVAKNRNGAVGECRLTFLRQHTRYESAAYKTYDELGTETNY